MHAGAYGGRSRHLRAGISHGGCCIGCCWALMIALIALGIMTRLDGRVLRGHHAREALAPRRAAPYAVGVGLAVLGLLAPWHPGLPASTAAPMTMTMAGM